MEGETERHREKEGDRKSECENFQGTYKNL